MSARVLIASRHDPFTDRPQPLQVLGTAIGLARAGARVTLVMDSHLRGMGRVDVQHRLGQSMAGIDLRLVQGGNPGLRGMSRRAVLVGLLLKDWDLVLVRDFKLTPLVARAHGGAVLAHEWHALPSALGQTDEGEARVARLAGLHVCVSRGLEGYLRETLLPHGAHTLVAPNGCFLDGDAARANIGQLADARRVFCAGLFRQPAAEEVVRGLAGRLPDRVQLRVVGKEIEGGIDSRAAVAPREIPGLLTGSLCQLALYRRDLNTERFASPLKVVQAMATGVPLVATDVPMVRELVEDRRTALLVPPDDADAVVEAVAELDGDRDLACALADNALQAAADLTWERRGRTLLEALE